MSIIEALEVLKRNCLEHPNCTGCCIYDGDQCQFEYTPPFDIEIERISDDK